VSALYHFTCEHHAGAIRRVGVLRPSPVLAYFVPLVWMTDLGVPDRRGLGLTSTILACDRLTFRFRASDSRSVVAWNVFKRGRLPRGVIERLEAAPGALPSHWFVSEVPVPVVEEPR